MRGWTAALIVAGVIGLLVLAFGHRLGEGDGEDVMRLVYLGLLASFVGAGLFSGGWHTVRADLKALLFWAVALFAVAAVYALRQDFVAVGQRVLTALVPGMAAEKPGELTVTRGRDGMFIVPGKVNGAAVRFLFDTGASGLSLSAEDAKAAGISVNESDFSITTSTANGLAKVAPVILDRLEIGSTVFRRVAATVSRPGALNRSLLGHEVLDRLDSYEVRGDRLILRTRPR